MLLFLFYQGAYVCIIVSLVIFISLVICISLVISVSIVICVSLVICVYLVISVSLVTCVFLHPPANIYKYDLSNSTDYHSKNRVKILCKDLARMPLDLLPRPIVLGEFWNYRTLVSMFT